MSKKEKLKKLNTRNINKKLNRNEVLNNHLKSEKKELSYELARNLEKNLEIFFWDIIILLYSYYDSGENEVLFVKFEARVLDLWLDEVSWVQVHTFQLIRFKIQENGPPGSLTKILKNQTSRLLENALQTIKSMSK